MIKIKDFLFNIQRGNKLYLIFLTFIRLTLITAIILSAFKSDWIDLFVSILTFILTFLPSIFEKKYKIDIPEEFELMIVLFIYAGIFLGEVQKYYTKFWWWDIILHIESGLAIGFIGFIILFILYKGEKINANPGLIALFSFLFALGIGALWEIFEFTMDQTLGLNMQKSGLVDTMWDLIVDALGALITAISGYLYLVKGESFIYKRIIDRIYKKNPNFLKNRR